ncbi:hypothetical protein QE177_04330 [Arsenophonus sp. aPb]|uniref:hypothetical protein n=1 Tax=Arsenophonus sp. aPb TaxID=3041619 RepID=UPI0024692FA2|nr:hypothetical protein [Arsenophonus sp. aPb]WGL99114.1 hypothetical protein QE177_04330 [Arsenophonus sp. aPb]
MLIQYAIHDINDEEDRYELEINSYDEKWSDLIATQCAEDYHNNHDGWESDWPLVIRIFANNEIIGDFKVEMEFWPSFPAKKLGSNHD